MTTALRKRNGNGKTGELATARPVHDPTELGDHWTDEEFESYLGPLPKDLEAVWRKVDGCADNMNAESLTAGRLLLYIRKITPYGRFNEVLEERSPYGRTISYFLMAMAEFDKKNPHLRSEWPRVRKLKKCHQHTLFGMLEEYTESIIKGEGPESIPNLTVFSSMSKRKAQDEARKLKEQNKKGMEQDIKSQDEIRRLKEENLTLKIGPKTDLETGVLCQEIQGSITIGLQQLRSLVAKMDGKTEVSRDYVLSTILAVVKNASLLEIDALVALDPAAYVSSGERIALECRPDGIHWHEKTVVTFLTEATRKANPDGAPGEDEDEEGEAEGGEELNLSLPAQRLGLARMKRVEDAQGPQE